MTPVRPRPARLEAVSSDSLSLSDVVGRNPGALSAGIDGEIVALDVANGTCFGLDPIASRVWTLMQTPKAIGEICRELQAEYEVEPETCEADILDLIRDLRAEGLALVRPAPDDPGR